MSLDARKTRPETWLAAVWTLLLRLILLAAIGYFLYRVRAIIVVVLVAVMLAFTMAPLVDWLQRSSWFRPLPRHHRRSVATILVFGLLTIGLVELVALVIQPLTREITVLTRDWHLNHLPWRERVHWLQDQYARLPDDLRDRIEALDFKEIGLRAAEQLQQVLQRTVQSGMFLIESILIPVLAYSFLTESRPIKHEFALFIPRSRVRDVLYVLRQCGLILQSYAVGQLILALIAGVTVWLVSTLLGLKFTLAMASIAAVTRVIPVVGPLIGGIPITLLALLQPHGWQNAVVMIVVLTLMHLVETKVIMPRIIGNRINLHPALVIIVLLIGAEFFGMWGMFLAAPAAAILKMLLHHFYVRPNVREPRGPSAPLPPPAAAPTKEAEVERPSIPGLGHHSGAH